MAATRTIALCAVAFGAGWYLRQQTMPQVASLPCHDARRRTPQTVARSLLQARDTIERMEPVLLPLAAGERIRVTDATRLVAALS
jgi:hypothetical protein